MPFLLIRDRRNEILFYTLLATLLVAPIATHSTLGGLGIQLVMGINLFAALIREVHRPRGRVMVGLVVVLMVLRIVAGLMEWPRLEATVVTVLAGVALVAAGLAVRFALMGDKVDSEHVFAALSAYLLTGIFCGVMYWQLERLVPGSVVVGSGGPFPMQTAIYFSFMTLATVGFGDIVPGSDLTRGLATLEAVVGQLYVAVMIARLLSLYVGRRRSARKP